MKIVVAGVGYVGVVPGARVAESGLVVSAWVLPKANGKW